MALIEIIAALFSKAKKHYTDAEYTEYMAAEEPDNDYNVMEVVQSSNPLPCELFRYRIVNTQTGKVSENTIRGMSQPIHFNNSNNYTTK